MKITIKELNDFLQQQDFYNLSDNIYNSHVEKAIEIIVNNRKEKPIVLLCGPSGASKTTTAQKITQGLINKGINCGYLSMDDYFFSLSEKEKSLTDSANLEAPERVDFNLFNSHLQDLILDKKIQMPYYDFKKSQRIDNAKGLYRNGGVIIVEGIHALNNNYIKFMDKCTKLYINVGCDIILDNGHIFKGKQIRLLRRICRDRVHRNRDMLGTINQYKNVSWGEDNFIKPFKSSADYILTTFSYYEMSCYKFLLDDVLDNQYKEILGSEEIFKEIVSINPKNIPINSHIKEFV